MQNQQLVSLFFDQAVKSVHSALIAKATMPVLVCLALAGNLLVQTPNNSETSLEEQFAQLGWRPISVLPDFLLPKLPDGFDGAGQSTVLSALPKQQRNLVDYVARAYRVPKMDVAHFVSMAFAEAKKQNVDPFLVVAIMSIESSFNPSAQSPVGAQGLMQVHTRVHQEKFAEFGGPAAAFDVAANIHVGTRIIREYLRREGGVEAALKSYVGAALLPDDGGYGWKVMGQMQRLKAIAAGRPIPNIPAQRPTQETAESGPVIVEPGVANAVPSTEAVNVERVSLYQSNVGLEAKQGSASLDLASTLPH